MSSEGAVVKDVSSRAVSTAALAALVAVAAFLPSLPALSGWGQLPVIVAVALVVLAVAVGWPTLLRLPNPAGSATVIALVAIGAVIAVAGTPDHPHLRNLPIVVALGVLLAFVNELARRDGRPRVLDSATGTVAGMVIAAAAAGWIAAGRGAGGVSLVVAGAVGLAVASATTAIPLGDWLGAGATTLAGVVGAGSVALVMPALTIVPGVALGLAIGMLVAALHALFVALPTLRSRWAAGAAIALPVAVSGFLVYVVGRVLLG